jgi:hypothetical protein
MFKVCPYQVSLQPAQFRGVPLVNPTADVDSGFSECAEAVAKACEAVHVHMREGRVPVTLSRQYRLSWT